jgi:hypothetical protein
MKYFSWKNLVGRDISYLEHNIRMGVETILLGDPELNYSALGQD